MKLSKSTVIIILVIASIALLLFTAQKSKVESFDDCWCRGGAISSSNTKVFNKNLVGPWTGSSNNTGSFTFTGGTQVWTISGSAWSNAANTLCQLVCTIDGTQTFNTSFWINPANQHSTFPAMLFSTSLPAGAHTFAITLSGGASCVSDTNDFVQISALEFPQPSTVSGSGH